MSCYYSDANSSTYNPKMIKNCQECIIECGDRLSHRTMTKAEEQALKAYPAERGHMHDRPYQREGFVKGYEQAQQDFLEKVEKWLAENIDVMIYPRNAVIENFKKAMNERYEQQ